LEQITFVIFEGNPGIGMVARDGAEDSGKEREIWKLAQMQFVELKCGVGGIILGRKHSGKAKESRLENADLHYK
jgi:hypothetical protein